MTNLELTNKLKWAIQAFYNDEDIRPFEELPSFAEIQLTNFEVKFPSDEKAVHVYITSFRPYLIIGKNGRDYTALLEFLKKCVDGYELYVTLQEPTFIKPIKETKPTMDSLISKVFEVSKSVPNRNLYYVLAKLQEEVGELATEVAITEGDSYKTPSKDGLIGEALDVLTCCLDIIYLNRPDITETEILNILDAKLEKWKTLATNFKKEI
jgi:NTP pyrophosphatase (non-canonical NTP hydrolase)